MNFSEQLKAAGYRFEIRYNNTLVSALTMAIPPVQKSYREPSRSAVNRTQGGAVVLDFGADNKTINFSGAISKNLSYYMDKRDVGSGVSGIETYDDGNKMDGDSIFKVFKERIARYRDNLAKLTNADKPDYAKVDVRFYDYYDDEYWVVNIDSFDWTENSGQPKWINFTMNMTTLERFIDLSVDRYVATKKKDREKKLTGKDKTVSQQSLMQKIKAELNKIKAALYAIKRQLQLVMRNIKQFVEDIETMVNDVNKIVETFTSLGTLPLDTITSVINTINGMITSLITLPFRTVAQITLSLRRLNNSLRGLQSTFSTERNRHNFSMLAGKGIGMQVQSGANDGTTPNTFQGVANIDAILANGGGMRIMRKGLTLQSIASQVFGDASLYPLIMIENNISITNVIVGQIVYIPSNDPRARDAYLTDLKFDSGGFSVASFGDLNTVSDVENVIDNIQRRILLLQGAYYRFPDLGIETVVGRPSSEFLRKIVRINIIEAIMSDFRISNVVSVSFTEADSAYKMAVKIKLINGEQIEVNL